MILSPFTPGLVKAGHSRSRQPLQLRECACAILSFKTDPTDEAPARGGDMRRTPIGQGRREMQESACIYITRDKLLPVHTASSVLSGGKKDAGAGDCDSGMAPGAAATDWPLLSAVVVIA